MLNVNDIIQIISALFGSLGFALLFNVRSGLLTFASLGGAFSWIIFLEAEKLTHNYFTACFAASAFSAFYGEIIARIKKTPASVFFIPAVVPLIPGASLYYAMSYAVRSDFALFGKYISLTIQYSLGIACGISIAWAIWYMCQKLISDIINKKRSEQ